MSYEGLLIHTCTIENPIEGTINAYGNEIPQYDNPVTGVPCRLVENTEGWTRERVLSDERQESVVQSMYKLLIGGEENLQERARITRVTLEDGINLDDTFVVTLLVVRRGKVARLKTAMLERIS